MSTDTNANNTNTKCKCSPRARAVCGAHDCRRSFAAHARARYWSPDNLQRPYQVIISCRKPYEFDCGHGHRFSYPLFKVVRNHQWCWYCNNKTEIKLLDWLADVMSGERIVPQPRFEWCRNPDTGHHLPFDLSIPGLKLLVELDGRQHYLEKRGWPSPIPMQRRDLYKMKLAIQHGWTVVRILQESVWMDRDDWETRVKVHLRSHKTPRGILLDTDKCEYEPLREMMQRDKIAGTNE